METLFCAAIQDEDPNFYRGWHEVDPVKPEDVTVKIIPRQQWEALKPVEDKMKENKLPVEYMYTTWLFGLRELFWEDMKSCKKSINRLQEHYMREGLPDIPYSFIIDTEGRIYEGRGWKYKPAVKIKHSCIDIAFAPKTEIKSSSGAYLGMLEKGLQLAHFGIKKGFIDPGYQTLNRNVNEEAAFLT